MRKTVGADVSKDFIILLHDIIEAYNGGEAG